MESNRKAFPVRRRVAAILYAGTAIASLLFGVIYLCRRSFMPYHAVAVGKGWDELDHATRVLLKALMEVAAGGWLALGVVVLVLVSIPIRRGERWARFTAPAALLLFYAPTAAATFNVFQQTPGSPPFGVTVAACAIAIVGLLLDAPWRRERQAELD